VKDLEPATRNRVRLQADAGTLGVAIASAFPDSAVEGAYLHLDASRADTLTTTVGEDGRTYVSEWRDCDGTGRAATAHAGAGLPFLSATTVVDGHALVDFGAYKGEENKSYAYWEELKGPAGSLSFPRTTEVREIFAVFEDTQRSNKCAFVVGDDYSYQLHRASNPNATQNLLADSWCASTLRNNLAMVDGATCAWNVAGDFTQLTVASVVSVGAGVNANTLCNDRNGLRMGGARIAELLIYTKELTVAERERNQLYLRRKWTHRKLPWEDLREVRLANNTTLDVKAGSVTTDLLTVPAGATVTKTGAGELRVQSLPQDGFGIKVKGGCVSFAASKEPVTDDAPAANPSFWFDASCAESLVAADVDDGTGRAYISRWNDCRPDATAYAYTRATDTTHPYVVPNALNGLPVVDFGSAWLKEWGDWGVASGDSARMNVSGYRASYDAFIVLRTKCLNGYSTSDHAYQNPPLFGTSNQDFTRWGGGASVAGYGGIGAHAGLWEFNGVPYETWNVAPPVTTNEFTVISLAAEDLCAADSYLANDRDIVCGGVQIAEAIHYDRKLTSAERKATQAYLMKKWLGKPHPAQAGSIHLSSLAFAPGVDAVIETDRDVRVDTLVADGALVVKGGGSVTLTAGDPFADALFHLDATAADTLVTTVDDQGDTRVTQWNDVRGNGARAVSEPGYGVSVLHPTLATVETRAGKSMPVIDFGGVNVSGAANPKDGTAAGMRLYRDGWNGSIREGHVVYCDAHGGIDHRFIFSDLDDYPCHRGDSNGQLFCNYNGNGAAYIKAGGVWVDGIPRSWNYCMTDQQFHLVSLMTSDPIRNRTVARDRNARSGGSYQGELLLFAEPLTDARRTYLQQYLQWKWFGEGEKPRMACPFETVSLVGGTYVNLPAYWDVQTPSLTGTGALTAGAITGVAFLEVGDAPGAAGSLAVMGDLALGADADLVFDLASPEAYDTLTVKGTFTVQDDATLTVNVGKGLDNASGTFTLLKAGALAGADLLKLARVVNNASNRAILLSVRDGELRLTLAPKGTTLFVR